MRISTRDAREIRRGIVTARQVVARKRARPRNMTPFGFRDAPAMPLWEQAYHREFTKAVRDGRIQPPRGVSGIFVPPQD